MMAGASIFEAGLPAERWSGFVKARPRILWVSLAVLALGLVLTYWFARTQHTYAHQENDDYFQRSADMAVQQLQGRIADYEKALRAGVGLMSVDKTVGREAFRHFVNQIRFFEELPGVQGFGYAERLLPQQVAPHVAAVRSEGFPGYAVHPAGERDAYSAIKYIEPMAGRNQHAFGYDMYSEPVRRAAMDAAWTTGAITMSGRVKLLQEKDETRPQWGFLMYAPLYQSGAAAARAGPQRDALRGWVYFPFRAQDLMTAALGQWQQQRGNGLRLRVFDGPEASPDHLLFDTHDGTHWPTEKQAGAHETQRRLDLSSRQWTLQFRAEPGYDMARQADRPWKAGALGSAVSVLLAWVMGLLVLQRTRDNAMTEKLAKRFMESEGRFRYMGDAAPMLIRITSADGCTSWINRGWREFLGKWNTDVDCSLVEASVHPDDAADWKERTQEAMEVRIPYQLEFRMRNAMGGFRWLMEQGRPRFTEQGEYLGYVASAVDVTHQKQYEAELRRNSEELEAIFQSHPDGVILVDGQGRILKSNTRMLALTGYRADELTGQSVDMLVPGGARPHHNRMVQSYMAQPKTRSMGQGRDLEARRQDGTTFPTEISLSPVSVDGERCVIATMRDMSERVTAQRKLAAALATAEAASRAKSDFVANMSHEIRTPLNGVLGMAELMQGTTLNPVQRKYLDLLSASAGGLFSVVNAILDFSKIESGRMQLESVHFNVREVVYQVVKSLYPQAQEKGVHLVSFVDVNVPSNLEGDPVRVRQILWNLVGNAIKFTPARGDVLVSLTLSRPLKATHVASLTFAVKDSGIGIADDKFELIFQQFTQADNSTTRHFGGTGLGLAICRSLALLMGGDIVVDSKVGAGSTFSLQADFPVSEPGQSAQDRCHALDGHGILVACDHPASRRVQVDLLSQSGAVVHAAQSGKEVLDLLDDTLRAEQVDVLVLDLCDAHRSGRDVAATIARRPDAARWSVVVLGHADGPQTHGTASTAMPPRCWTLIKPVMADELLEVVRTAVANPGEATPSIATTASTAPCPFVAHTVLLAEDNPVNRLAVVTALRQRGHTVVEATDGVEAVKAFRHQPFDLVLMDMHMPNMDGLEATRQIRTLEADGRHTRIVALTASALVEDRDRCLNAGMDSHLTKPIVLADLVREVEELAPATAQALPAGVLSARHPLLARLFAQAGHDLNFALTMVDACRDDLPTRITAVEQAMNQADSHLLSRAAHSMKGMVALFTDGPLVQILQQIEARGRDGDLALATAKQADYLDALHAFTEALGAVRCDLAEQGAKTEPEDEAFDAQ